MKIIGLITVLAILLSFACPVNPIENIWYNGTKSAKVQIYKSGNHYEGKVVWLREPKDENHLDKLDVHNPESKLRTTPVIGMVILKNLRENEKNVFSGGTIYDPKNGKTYSCKITIVDAANLDLRGFIGISILGKTEHWIIAN